MKRKIPQQYFGEAAKLDKNGKPIDPITTESLFIEHMYSVFVDGKEAGSLHNHSIKNATKTAMRQVPFELKRGLILGPRIIREEDGKVKFIAIKESVRYSMYKGSYSKPLRCSRFKVKKVSGAGKVLHEYEVNVYQDRILWR